jgi:hypothetical protein
MYESERARAGQFAISAAAVVESIIGTSAFVDRRMVSALAAAIRLASSGFRCTAKSRGGLLYRQLHDHLLP